jgi:hypothetical protein
LIASVQKIFVNTRKHKRTDAGAEEFPKLHAKFWCTLTVRRIMGHEFKVKDYKTGSKCKKSKAFSVTGRGGP